MLAPKDLKVHRVHKALKVQWAQLAAPDLKALPDQLAQPDRLAPKDQRAIPEPAFKSKAPPLSGHPQQLLMKETCGSSAALFLLVPLLVPLRAMALCGMVRHGSMQDLFEAPRERQVPRATLGLKALLD
jgi:hypothetical protein